MRSWLAPFKIRPLRFVLVARPVWELRKNRDLSRLYRIDRAKRLLHER